MRPVVSIILAILLSADGKAQQKTLPASLKSFVLKGYEMLDFVEGDLDGDKKADAILILKTPGEDTLMEQELDRPFLLLIRQADGKLKLEKRNDKLVMCAHCGGVFGDPYQETTITKDGFSISFYGGSSWRWEYDYSFTYKPSAKNWFLTKEHQLLYHNTEPEINPKETVIEETELGVIAVEKFNVDPPYVENTWKVIAAKSFFYDTPKIGSKTRKGYMVKGDIAVGIRELKNFIEVSFQHKDDFTTGYILKSTLTRVK